MTKCSLCHAPLASSTLVALLDHRGVCEGEKVYRKQMRRLEIANQLLGRTHGTAGTVEHRESHTAMEHRWTVAQASGEIETQLLAEGFTVAEPGYDTEAEQQEFDRFLAKLRAKP